MARRPNRRKKKPTGLKPLTRGQVVTLWSVLLLASPLAYPSLICLGLALLPSFIAWKLESGGDRYLGGSIAVMNVPAALPVVFDVLRRGHDSAALVAVLSEPVSWLLPYGAAALAAMIYVAMPSFVIPFYFGRSGRRVTELEERRTELLEAWGDEIDPGEISVKFDDEDDEDADEDDDIEDERDAA